MPQYNAEAKCPQCDHLLGCHTHLFHGRENSMGCNEDVHIIGQARQRLCHCKWIPPSGALEYFKIPELLPAKELTNHQLLHRLWTRAVGTHDYNKQDWIELESRLHRLSEFVSMTAETTTLQVVNEERRKQRYFYVNGGHTQYARPLIEFTCGRCNRAGSAVMTEDGVILCMQCDKDELI